HPVSYSNSETDIPILASIYRVPLIRHERSAVLRLECARRLIPARRPHRPRLRETADSDNASSEMVRERYGEACGKEVSGPELQRTHRRCCPSTTCRWMPFSPLSRHRMFDHGASDDRLSLFPLVSPIVSLRALIRLCCLFSKFKARNTYYDRPSAFTPPLLRGLGEIPAASCRGHRAPYRRAACLAQHAAPLVDWHVRDAYYCKSRLVVPRTDGRGERRSDFPRIMGSGSL